MPDDKKEESKKSDNHSHQEKQTGQVVTKFRDIDFSLGNKGDNKKNNKKNGKKGGSGN